MTVKTRDFTDEEEVERALLKKHGWKIRLAVFLTEFNALFSFQTLVSLLPHFYNKVNNAGRDGDLVETYLMTVNTVMLLITHVVNLLLVPRRFTAGYCILRFCLLLFIVLFSLILVFPSQPVVLFVGAALAAMCGSSIEGELWALAPIFPAIDDKIRAMISSGNGFNKSNFRDKILKANVLFAF